jgi:hypothetical protein
MGHLNNNNNIVKKQRPPTKLKRPAF